MTRHRRERRRRIRAAEGLAGVQVHQGQLGQSLQVAEVSQDRRHEAYRDAAANEGPVAHRLQARHILHGLIPPPPALRHERPPYC